MFVSSFDHLLKIIRKATFSNQIVYVKYLIILINSFLMLFTNVNKKEIKMSTLSESNKYMSFTEDISLLSDRFFYHSPCLGSLSLFKNKKLIFEENRTYYLSFFFTENIDSFTGCNFLEDIGFSIQLKREEKNLQDTVFKENTDFKTVFFADEEINLFADLDFKIVKQMSFKKNEDLFLLTFKLKIMKGDMIDSFKMNYSDDPVIIKNITLSKEDAFNKRELVELEDEYVIRPDVFYIDSQYGMTLSLNYILLKSKICTKNYTLIDEQNYFSNSKKAGIGMNYSISILIKNENHLYSYIYHIKIVDTFAPVIKKIKKEKEVNCSYKEIEDTLFVYRYFKIVDNYSSVFKIRLTDKKGDRIQKKVGKVECTMTVLDEYKNRSEFSFFLRVTDDEKPIIEARYDHFFTNMNHFLSKEEMLSYIFSQDEIDESVELKISEDNYSDFADEKGTYSILIDAFDKSKNRSTKEIFIHVSPSDFIYYIGEREIRIKDTTFYNEGELLESLKTYNIIDDSYSNMYFNKDIKELQSEEEVSLILESEHSNSKKDFLITIEKHESRNESFLEKINNFFDRLFSDISSFFKRLFHL